MKHWRFRSQFRVEKAVAHLEDLIKTHAEAGRLRLPTVKTLVKTTGISSATMSKALHILRNRGTITLSQRKGILLVKEAITAQFELLKSSRVEAGASRTIPRLSLCQRIQHDLYLGDLLVDESLPTFKEMSARYGACYSTTVKALEELVTLGILSRYKKGYRFVIPAVAKHLSRLVIIRKSESLRDLEHQTPRSAEFWRLVERECARRELNLEIWSFADFKRNLAASQLSSQIHAEKKGDILGFVVLTLGADSDELQSILSALARFYLPTSVIDETGYVTIPSMVSSNPHMRLFIMSTSSTPGQRVGSHLLKLGHRNAAYITILPNVDWSRNRWRGIADAYSKAGTGSAKLVGSDESNEWARFYGAHPRGELFSSIKPWLTKIQSIVDPAGKPEFDELYYNLLSPLWNAKLRALMLPLFETALKDRTVTAWVLESDGTAVMALDFLKSRSIRVPEEISVIGFDNSIEGLGAGLTSYDFNVGGLVSAVMNHTLATESNRRIFNKGPMEIPGTIVERQTTRLRAVAG